MAPSMALMMVMAAAMLVCTHAITSSTKGNITVTYAQANGLAPGGAADLPLQVLSRSVYGEQFQLAVSRQLIWQPQSQTKHLPQHCDAWRRRCDFIIIDIATALQASPLTKST